MAYIVSYQDNFQDDLYLTETHGFGDRGQAKDFHELETAIRAAVACATGYDSAIGPRTFVLSEDESESFFDSEDIFEDYVKADWQLDCCCEEGMTELESNLYSLALALYKQYDFASSLKVVELLPELSGMRAFVVQ